LEVQLLDNDIHELSKADKVVALAALRHIYSMCPVEHKPALAKLGQWLKESIEKGKSK
jgi:hypothetical protein